MTTSSRKILQFNAEAFCKLSPKDQEAAIEAQKERNSQAQMELLAKTRLAQMKLLAEEFESLQRELVQIETPLQNEEVVVVEKELDSVSEEGEMNRVPEIEAKRGRSLSPDNHDADSDSNTSCSLSPEYDNRKSRSISRQEEEEEEEEDSRSDSIVRGQYSDKLPVKGICY